MFLIFCCHSWNVLNFSLFLRLGIRTVQISNVFYITKRLIPYIHPHTWWKTCFDRESIGQFGTSLQIERFEKFKAGCKRMLLNFGESLCKVWTTRIIGIFMSLHLTYHNILHNYNIFYMTSKVTNIVFRSLKHFQNTFWKRNNDFSVITSDFNILHILLLKHHITRSLSTCSCARW